MPHLMKKVRPYLSEDTILDILWQHGRWKEMTTAKKNGLRNRNLVEFRALYYFILYHFTQMSLNDIGKLFKDDKGRPKDHATVLHGHKNFFDVYLKYNNGTLSATYENVMAHINNLLQIKGFTPHLATTKMSKGEAMHYIQHQRKIMFSLIKKQASLLERIKLLEKLS